uniref:Uncharacterized protein AlNc14C126G6822 n=1 Tax=Albugo laibachii Nc14 TaxID=890382 RepID=F0WJV2_9STRA|nr:conserved hypothetical protein [Albugo laibachii Nc14]|eukprot:CCA21554.1 conserved hypothetical protein [Albugo laibachii Nc14]
MVSLQFARLKTQSEDLSNGRKSSVEIGDSPLNPTSLHDNLLDEVSRSSAPQSPHQPIDVYHQDIVLPNSSEPHETPYQTQPTNTPSSTSRTNSVPPQFSLHHIPSLTKRGIKAKSQLPFHRHPDFFKCPELTHPMKLYLVQKANETANLLIRDSLQHNPSSSMVWQEYTVVDGVPVYRGFDRGQGGTTTLLGAPMLPKHQIPDHGHLTDENTVPGFSETSACCHDPLERNICCLRSVTDVNASLEEFALLFQSDARSPSAVPKYKLKLRKRYSFHGIKSKTGLHQSCMTNSRESDVAAMNKEHELLFNGDVLDTETLYSLVQPSYKHPRRLVAIRWALIQSASKFVRNRDFCFVECQKEFRDGNGRRGWVRSVHSVRLACCPSFEASHNIVRGSLYRCGLIAIQSATNPNVLETTYTMEMDLKGRMPEKILRSFLCYRMASIGKVNKLLQRQRLSSSPLLGDLDIPARQNKPTCHLCFRLFRALRVRRYVCRRCGEFICSNCSDDWLLEIPVIGLKRVRVCTYCSADARSLHILGPKSEQERGDDFLGQPYVYPKAHSLDSYQYEDDSENEESASHSQEDQDHYPNVPMSRYSELFVFDDFSERPRYREPVRSTAQRQDLQYPSDSEVYKSNLTDRRGDMFDHRQMPVRYKTGLETNPLRRIQSHEIQRRLVHSGKHRRPNSEQFSRNDVRSIQERHTLDCEPMSMNPRVTDRRMQNLSAGRSMYPQREEKIPRPIPLPRAQAATPSRERPAEKACPGARKSLIQNRQSRSSHTGEPSEQEVDNSISLASSELFEYTEGENGEWIAKKKLSLVSLTERKKLRPVSPKKAQVLSQTQNSLGDHLDELINQEDLAASVVAEENGSFSRTIVEPENLHLPLLDSQRSSGVMELEDCPGCGTKFQQVLRDGMLRDVCFCPIGKENDVRYQARNRRSQELFDTTLESRVPGLSAVKPSTSPSSPVSTTSTLSNSEKPIRE